MRPHITAIRAIGSEFLRRKLVPIVIIGLIIGIICTSGAVLLVVLVSIWWILLLLAVFIVEICTFSLLVITFVLLRTIRPTLSHEQVSAVRDFVNKLERVADHIGMPKFVILFRVIKDVIRPHGTTFIQQVVDDSATLQIDYQALQKQFTS